MSNQEQPQPRQLSKRAQTARFVVSLDHQAKRSFDNLKDAQIEAKRIADAFPMLNVEVNDMENGTLKPASDERNNADEALDGAN